MTDPRPDPEARTEALVVSLGKLADRVETVTAKLTRQKRITYLLLALIVAMAGGGYLLWQVQREQQNLIRQNCGLYGLIMRNYNPTRLAGLPAEQREAQYLDYQAIWDQARDLGCTGQPTRPTVVPTPTPSPSPR